MSLEHDYLATARQRLVERRRRPAPVPPLAPCTSTEYEINEINEERAATRDEFSDLPARLACGCLRGYGQLVLADGTLVLWVEGYVQTRLTDLEWPQLTATAMRQLQRLRAALTQLDGRAGEE